jgi:hypothetical protein
MGSLVVNGKNDILIMDLHRLPALYYHALTLKHGHFPQNLEAP